MTRALDPDISISKFVADQNRHKVVFTAGPASLLAENLLGLRPCFGRGDADYDAVEASVMTSLKNMTGHAYIVRLQGAASLALEIAVQNFISGKVLIVQSGFYSQRLAMFARMAQASLGAITHVDECDWDKTLDVGTNYDWIIACHTETSRGLLTGIRELEALKKATSGRLLFDATASIGLESGHEIADVVCYSSCKGLFGLTGAAFVAFNEAPQVEVPSFFMKLATHADKMTTGPYHAIASLYEVLPKHSDFRAAVVENKKHFVRKFGEQLYFPQDRQPLLCTWVKGTLTSREPHTILYTPRDLPTGSVVCHLGEVHLGTAARGGILDLLEMSEA